MSKIKLVKLPGQPFPSDLERWRAKYESSDVTPQDLENEGVIVEEIDATGVGMTLVRVGDDTYKPSPQDLGEWRLLLENAACDPDFKIFTNHGIKIEYIVTDSNDDFCGNNSSQPATPMIHETIEVVKWRDTEITITHGNLQGGSDGSLFLL
ncbi:MAG TPA: hypothetical protein VI423_08095 [Paenisporosarcina sp.]|nr:hypothetical protein [Paenisporosarcina sp.]